MKIDKSFYTVVLLVGFVALVALGSFAIMPTQVFAQSGGGDIGPTLPNPLGENNTSLLCFLKNILDTVLTVGLVVAALFFIYSGYLFVTARADASQLIVARKSFFGAVIGTVILMSVWGILLVIINTVNSIGDSEFSLDLDC